MSAKNDVTKCPIALHPTVTHTSRCVQCTPFYQSLATTGASAQLRTGPTSRERPWSCTRCTNRGKRNAIVLMSRPHGRYSHTHTLVPK